ncbi:sensor histidine kinase [Paenibacillus radicis (ex Xue et al. 2023)]|uniref:Histidine kinase n=1 Tax=Paenibacillus radicis (ex Xue et al. 2023) TaxID=2972489 RepID=A0ABT1YGF6_9BACL|nr:histidine kinase [Paenibacillus radicis (ex Xue et al. 2023)]MCR8632284.1 histidine kinase [Paenibacillus radicis (ex Xue et al. 2023)]
MYKRSLFVKLLVWTLLATAIPFICSNLISYRSTSASLQENMIELNQKTMNIGMENMKKYLQELNQLSVSWYYDPNMLSYLWLEKPSFDQDTYIDRQLSYLFSSRSEIKLVNFYSGMSGQKYTKFNYSVFSAVPRQVLPTERKEDWTSVPEYEMKQVNGERFLTINKKMIDYPKPNVLGLLSIYFSLDEIERLGRQLLDPSHETVFLFMNNNKELLYTSSGLPDIRNMLEDEKPDLRMTGERQGYWYGQLDGKKGVFITVADQYLNVPLTMIKFIPSDFINQAARRTLDQSMAIQIIAFAVIILFTFILSYSTIAPIKRLIRNMTRVEIGQFDVEQFKTREDEIGILELRFQTMVRNLKDMIFREYQQRIEISTAQLKMLQAQINPHFLYNTLQSIGTIALRHRVDEISDKISQLGAILRYSMDFHTETVYLQKEIEHIEHYLSLQESRFKSKLFYSIECEPAALKVMVPKMILQPLVENSIIHGIENGLGAGTVHLDIHLDRTLTIRIIDNGKGMDYNEIEQVKLRFAEPQAYKQDAGGIGLINVLQRLRLKYGDSFTWQISSKPYEKTEIAFIIPIQEES